MNTVRRRWLTLAASATSAALASAAARAAANAPALDAVKPPALPAQKTIRLFGCDIRYVELGRAGQRPTLVLLHGLGSSAAGDWGQVMPALAKTHHVLALDQLGFGRSDKPLIQYGIQTWVDFLGEFLREKQAGAAGRGFTLMGESLGGWIAAQYTLQALRGESAGPSFVLPKPDRLVLCDAAGFRETLAPRFEKAPPAADADASTAAARKPGAGPSLAGEKALLASIFHAPSFSTDDAVRRGMAWGLAKGDSFTIASVSADPAILNEAIDGQLGGITVPTLVVWGAHDRIVPVALGQRYAREIPGARLTVLAEAGHAPMIETPQAFLAAVREFIAP